MNSSRELVFPASRPFVFNDTMNHTKANAKKKSETEVDKDDQDHVDGSHSRRASQEEWYQQQSKI